MKHIVQFSGGKDSTCMLLMMLERGMQVDEIIFCDTGMEFPQMYEHIEKVEQYVGRKITRLKAPHSFEYYLLEYRRTRGKYMHIKGLGWSTMQARRCTAHMKRDVFERYVRGMKYINYIGIASDEPKRHKNIPANVRHPLFEWGVSEKQALEYCYNHGFDWGGLYKKFDRVSCWCCPLQGLKELRTLYHEFPNLWARLKELDEKSWNQFREDYSVAELEAKFIREDNGKRIAISLWDE